MKRTLKVYEEQLNALRECRVVDVLLFEDLLADLKEFASLEEPESLFGEEGETEKCPLFIQALAEVRFKVEHGLESHSKNADNLNEMITSLEEREACIEAGCQMWGPLEIHQAKDMAYFGCALKREAVE